jgi:hypothetical protein
MLLNTSQQSHLLENSIRSRDLSIKPEVLYVKKTAGFKQIRKFRGNIERLNQTGYLHTIPAIIFSSIANILTI